MALSHIIIASSYRSRLHSEVPKNYKKYYLSYNKTLNYLNPILWIYHTLK